MTLEQPYRLGQSVTFAHSLYRTREWRTGEGTVRNWITNSFSGAGVVVGWRTLSDGVIKQYSESNEWHPSRHFRAYLVAFDLRCKPVYVLPEHMAARLDDQPDHHHTQSAPPKKEGTP